MSRIALVSRHDPIILLTALLLAIVGLWASPQASAFQRQENQYLNGLTTGVNEFTLEVQGRQRRYLLYLPHSVDRTKPAPLIFAFHGGGSNPEQFAKVTRLNSLAGDLRHYLVAYPAGYENFWHSGDDCCGPPLEEGLDDVAFVRAILSDIRDRIPVDPSRIYAVGFSNGGKMTYRIACELAGELTAIAVSGSSIGVTACHPRRPVSVLHFHGTNDTFHPYSGGPGTATRFQMPQTGAPETIKRWRAWNGCDTDGRVIFQKGDATCVTYDQCQNSSEVVLCTIERMGHQWPGFTVRFPVGLAKKLGPSTDDLDATRTALDFFGRHVRRK